MISQISCSIFAKMALEDRELLLLPSFPLELICSGFQNAKRSQRMKRLLESYPLVSQMHYVSLLKLPSLN
jgi:hypothetical protein